MSKTSLAVLFLSLAASSAPSRATEGQFRVVVNASRPATLTASRSPTSS